MNTQNKKEVTVVRVNTDTREKLNQLRKEISEKTRLNISTDNLLNILMHGFDHQKIRLVNDVF